MFGGKTRYFQGKKLLNKGVRIKRGYGCGTERIDGTDMRIKRGADMRIKRGADMRIKRGWVVFCAN